MNDSIFNALSLGTHKYIVFKASTVQLQKFECSLCNALQNNTCMHFVAMDISVEALDISVEAKVKQKIF